MNKKILVPKGSEAKKTYSHGIAVSIGDKEMIFVTGQIAAENGKAIAPNDIEKQTEFVFQKFLQSEINTLKNQNQFQLL